MRFRTHDDAEIYARDRYTSTASTIFGYFCRQDEDFMMWTAAAHATGTSWNSPGFSVGSDLRELYNDFDTPVETYGYASFHLDFDDTFELEERMPLPDFIDYLKDANAVACQMYPGDASKLEAYLEQAIAEITKLQKAHERWKRKNG